jgi:hypothetical protein
LHQLAAPFYLNLLLLSMLLPCWHCLLPCRPAGGLQYVPVDPSSLIFAAGASWRLPSFVVCLASSYLQRLVAQDALLAKAAGACPGFEMYHCSLPQKVRTQHRKVAVDLLLSFRIFVMLPS